MVGKCRREALAKVASVWLEWKSSLESYGESLGYQSGQVGCDGGGELVTVSSSLCPVSAPETRSSQKPQFFWGKVAGFQQRRDRFYPSVS